MDKYSDIIWMINPITKINTYNKYSNIICTIITISRSTPITKINTYNKYSNTPPKHLRCKKKASKKLQVSVTLYMKATGNLKSW